MDRRRAMYRLPFWSDLFPFFAACERDKMNLGEKNRCVQAWGRFYLFVYVFLCLGVDVACCLLVESSRHLHG